MAFLFAAPKTGRGIRTKRSREREPQAKRERASGSPADCRAARPSGGAQRRSALNSFHLLRLRNGLFGTSPRLRRGLLAGQTISSLSGRTRFAGLRPEEAASAWASGMERRVKTTFLHSDGKRKSVPAGGAFLIQVEGVEQSAPAKGSRKAKLERASGSLVDCRAAR